MVSVKVTGKFSKLEYLDKTLQAKKSVKWIQFCIYLVLMVIISIFLLKLFQNNYKNKKNKNVYYSNNKRSINILDF